MDNQSKQQKALSNDNDYLRQVSNYRFINNDTNSAIENNGSAIGKLKLQ